MLIYDHHKNLIFSSIDSLNIKKSSAILSELSIENDWIETKEDGYDLIGVYIENNANGYYGISKAYDFFGYSKKDFLQKVLIGIFIAIVIIVILVSIYLSNIISKPISELTSKIESYDLSDENKTPLHINTTTSELLNLTDKFNELIQRTDEAFLFQKNIIQHISHELKTPIAVLVSELEKIRNLNDSDAIKSELKLSTQKAKSLGSVIEVLLHISKVEAGQQMPMEKTRIDDLIFDCISEINTLYPNFNFEVNFSPENFDENNLYVVANHSLIKQAFMNLLLNAVHYSNNQKAEISFDGSSNALKIYISNQGKTISTDEQKYLFSHFFRGENAQNQQGFGLGLVLSQKIFAIHNATIEYHSENHSENVFTILFSPT